MKQFLLLLLGAVLCSSGPAAAQRLVRRSFERAAVQSRMLDSLLTAHNRFPSSCNPDGSIKLTSARGWTSGFFPGNLWFLYEYTGDGVWLEAARRRTMALDTIRHCTATHDLGFMIGCPALAAWRLTGDSSYRELVVDASEALITRFDPRVGVIRSWDNKGKAENPYRVIIDNMMNLEMLFMASELTGDDKYRKVALAHAETTLRNHFRADGSCYHIVCYDTATGRAERPQGGQGYSVSSAWARGQAWGLYGYTMCYRFTRDSRFLARAIRSASYILEHPNRPADGVPYWDYYAPGIPDEPRDASSAAVTASALLELARYVPEQERDYRAEAKRLLRTLASKRYLIPAGEKCGFLIDHSVGSKPAESQVDVPIIYGDYYFLEALLRLKNYSKER